MGKKKKSSSTHKNHSKIKPKESQNNEECNVSEQSIYKVKESETLGRYLVAAKNLKPGEVVMVDEPLVVGPCQEAKPLCLGCYTDINLKDCQSYSRCSKCSWPLCTSSCPGYHQKQGHGQEECDFLSKSSVKNKPITAFEKYYYAIAPFRCVLMKEKNPEIWKIIQTMESHTEDRKKSTKLWETNQKMAVNIIRNDWGLTQFTEDDIHFVCGILEVNAFEINLPALESKERYLRGIYPQAFLFSHDCVPNTCHSNDEKFQLIVRTTRNISVGDIISVSYAYTLQPTILRRRHLKETKFFLCCCKRCSDPTELGTFTGGMKCPMCKDGLVLPEDPLNSDSLWKCKTSKCRHEVQATLIIPLLDRLFKELDSINGNDVIEYERFLKKCYGILHENHYLCLSAMHCLSQLYGKIDGYLINDLTDEQLERKEEICRRLIKIFDRLEPGLSKQRGILLYELQAPLMVMLRKKFETQNISKKEVKSKIREVLKYLEESQLILSKESKNSTEGQMALAAEEAITSLRTWLGVLN